MDDFSYCIPAILIGLIPAAIAHSKGKDFMTWWVFGAALFIIALPAAILTAPDQKALEQRQIKAGNLRKCPHCAELIKREAKVCRFCGQPLTRSAATTLPPAAQAAPLQPIHTLAASQPLAGHLPQNAISASPFPDFPATAEPNPRDAWAEKVAEYYFFLGHQISKQIPIDQNTLDYVVAAKDGSMWYVRCQVGKPSTRSEDLADFQEHMTAANASKGAIISDGFFSAEGQVRVDPKKIALIDGEKFGLAFKRMIDRKTSGQTDTKD